jgi:hypothetical protein
MSKLSYDVDTKYLNQMFTDSLAAGDRVKCAQAGELYIRLRMREAPFCRKILPPQAITKEDCQRSEEHDTLIVMKDIAPEAEAVSLTFRGRPNHKYVQGKRFSIGLYKISSLEYEKAEEELLAYEMPITALLEEDIVKMMQYEEDSNFIHQCEDIVTRTNGKDIQVATSTGKIDKEALISLTNLIDGDELETACFLMSKTTWNDWSGQGSEVFDVGAWDVAKYGYKEETILGRKCYVTLKEDLVPRNVVWAFCSPEYLGYYFTLDEAKFWVDSKADLIHFKGWEYVGCGIGNTRAMARLTIV